MEGRRRWRGFEDAGGMLTISSIESFHFANYSSLFGGTVLQRQRSVESCAPSTTVRSLRELQWSPPPLSRGRMVRAISFSQRDPRRRYVPGEVRIERSSLRYSLRSIRATLANCVCISDCVF